jgi:hypothetical protein
VQSIFGGAAPAALECFFLHLAAYNQVPQGKNSLENCGHHSGVASNENNNY